MRSSKDKFDILLVNHPTKYIGSKAVLANFIEVLVPLTNKLFVVTSDFDTKVTAKAHVINLVNGRAEQGAFLPRLLRFLLLQLRLSCSVIKIARGVDIVFFFIGTRTYLLPMLCAKLLRKKVVLFVTSSIAAQVKVKYQGLKGFMLSFTLDTIEQIAFRLADQIAVETKNVVKSTGLQRYKNKTVISGAMYIDTNLFKANIAVSERGSIVGYIGRLHRAKGVMNLVQAIPLVINSNNDVRFLIIGDGECFDEMKREIKSNCLEDRVKIFGSSIPHDELPRYLNTLKLLIFPSYSEGLPGIVQEAMACGAIVVATPVGGVPDLIRDGETGFILEDNSPECIARTVVKALEHPHLDKIASHARKLIEDEYNYQAMVEKCRVALSRLM